MSEPKAEIFYCSAVCLVCITCNGCRSTCINCVTMLLTSSPEVDVAEVAAVTMVEAALLDLQFDHQTLQAIQGLVDGKHLLGRNLTQDLLGLAVDQTNQDATG